MRGENWRAALITVCVAGSSPHARGKLGTLGHALAPKGLIPACAGKTHSGKVADLIDEAHPRMRGENHQVAYGVRRVFGSSPHARGKLIVPSQARCVSRLIPACAGKTRWYNCRCCKCSAHPRMRGENIPTAKVKKSQSGSSPHARGKLAT